MYVWEKYLHQRISKARKDEMDILLKMFMAQFFAIATAIVIVNITFYLLLLANVWLDRSITAETMYFVIGCFIGLGITLISLVPYGTFYLSQIIVAIKRMQSLIRKLDVKTTKVSDVHVAQKPRIFLKNVSISTNNNLILKNVNLDIDKGLTLVTGPASSGKSVFLMTLLKEFEVSEGHLRTEGTISYAPQEAWLFASTIRQNIIFGSKYNEERYQAVIEACALVHDFYSLEKGDSTIVADQGINLSKGQKSRICLARAVYRQCEIYLLDNCLCSLDPLVAQFIFTNCILRFLKNKLVILVSHNSNLRPYATNILTLNKNTIELCRNIRPKDAETIPANSFLKNDMVHFQKSEPKKNHLSLENDCLIKNKSKRNIYSENETTRSVSLKTYQTYIELGGGIMFFFVIVITFIFTQISLSYKDKLLSEWANLEEEISQTPVFDDSQRFVISEKRNQVLMKYTLSTIGLSVMTFIRAFVLFLFCKKVSYNLHKKMLNSVIYAPMKFFDNNFVGNIINRFSKDLVSIDENIPFHLLHLTVIITETIGNLLLISSTNLRFLIPTAVLFASFIILRHVYLKTGQPLKALDASTKSPVIGYYNATLEGLTSIKAFGAEKLLKAEFENRHNTYNSASYSHLCCLKTYIFAVDVSTSIFIAAVTLLLLIFDEGVLPGDAGLAISQAFVMCTLGFAINQGADLETEMTSVERTFEFKNIKQEKRAGVEPENWPSRGKIEYENVCLSINNSQVYLLKNLTFVIKPQEKIGIVGRTGAGKTSILSALFRMYETSGKIKIDDIEIKNISLDILRSSISAIPQDSVLLDGPLRDNIDPGKHYEDDVIWKALETVKLKQCVPSLDTNVRDLDFTCGQKQLICLARVLIRNNKILVLDEMVENVDDETETLIHEIIDKNFSSCTVIKIAHKLKFVKECDKIMVLENGEVLEYDTHDVLLQNRNGVFYKMMTTSDFGLDS